jgi:hypothetical protein
MACAFTGEPFYVGENVILYNGTRYYDNVIIKDIVNNNGMCLYSVYIKEINSTIIAMNNNLIKRDGCTRPKNMYIKYCKLLYKCYKNSNMNYFYGNSIFHFNDIRYDKYLDEKDVATYFENRCIDYSIPE